MAFSCTSMKRPYLLFCSVLSFQLLNPVSAAQMRLLWVSKYKTQQLKLVSINSSNVSCYLSPKLLETVGLYFKLSTKVCLHSVRFISTVHNYNNYWEKNTSNTVLLTVTGCIVFLRLIELDHNIYYCPNFWSCKSN